jgi:hypothetical protein
VSVDVPTTEPAATPLSSSQRSAIADRELARAPVRARHVLHGPVIALDLALRLRVVGSASGVAHASIAEILPEPRASYGYAAIAIDGIGDLSISDRLRRREKPDDPEQSE